MLCSFLLVGLQAPYWHKAGANLVSVYEALLFNQGLPQEFLLYPNYLGPQLLGVWYQLLHAAHLIPYSKLAEVQTVNTIPQFDVVWQELVAWGYWYSFAIGSIYVFFATVLIRRLVGSTRVALLAGLALAFSDGVALAYRIMRPELISSALVFLALLLTLNAALATSNFIRCAMLGIAGLFVALGLTEKVQALLPALTIPVISLSFGRVDPSPDRTSEFHKIAAATLIVSALLIVPPTVQLMQLGTAAMLSSHLLAYRPLGNVAGTYQWLFLLYVGSCMAIYAWLWRTPPLVAITAALAVFVGLALGFLALYWRYDVEVVVAVANPIEHLHAMSATPEAALPTTSITTLVEKYVGGLFRALGVHTFIYSPTHRPTLIIEWLSIVAAFTLWRRGEKLSAMQITLLLLSAFAVDASFTLRGGQAGGLRTYYTPYTDPFIVLAGAIALRRFSSEFTSRRAKTAIIALAVVYVAWGNFEPARATYDEYPKRKVCIVAAQFMKRIDIPYCRKFDPRCSYKRLSPAELAPNALH
jgi:hypothetical protein